MSLRTSAALLVLSLALAGAHPAEGRAHPDPVELRDPLLVRLSLPAFMPFDEYDGFLRGSTGEFVFRAMRVDELRATQHPYDLTDVLHPGEPRSPYLREGVAGKQLTCLEPPGEGEGYPHCSGPLLFEHLQCHPIRSFRLRAEIWEDDSDSETMAAIRKLLKDGAAFALGAQDQLAATVAATVVEITGIGEWLEQLEASVREELVSVLGDDVGAIAGAALDLALDRTLADGYDAADERLRELSAATRQELSGLAKGLGLTDTIFEELADTDQGVLDKLLDQLIDVVIGTGPDFVGSVDEVIFPVGAVSGEDAAGSSRGYARTDPLDVGAGVGAALEPMVRWTRSEGASVCEPVPEADPPREAPPVLVPPGSRLVYPSPVAPDAFTQGSVLAGDGQPLADVPVERPPLVTITDEAGRFTLPPAQPSSPDPGPAPSVRVHRVADPDGVVAPVEAELGPASGQPELFPPDVVQWPRYVWWSDFRLAGEGLSCEPWRDRAVRMGDLEARILACDGRGGWTVQVPLGLPLGPVDLSVSVDGEPSAPRTVTSLRLEMDLEPPDIVRGQSGVANLRVLGTEEPVPLRIENRSPQTVRLEGGAVQRIETSGGEDNLVQVRYTGVSPGRFQLNVRVDRDD